MRSNGKRLGAMLLALVMVFSLLPTAAFAVRLDEEIAIDAPDTAADTAPAGTLDAGAVSAQLMETPPEISDIPNGYTLYTPSESELAVNCTQSNDDWGSYGKANLIDNDASSFWTAAYADSVKLDGTTPTQASDNHIYFNLASAKKVKGIYYLPRPSTGMGTFKAWKFQTSSDGSSWSDVSGAAGTWSVTQGDTAAWQYAELTDAIETQHIGLVSTDIIYQNNVYPASCAEIRLVVEASDFVSEADDNPFVTDGSDASEDMTLTADMLSANSVRTGSTLDKLLDGNNDGSHSWEVAWADSNAASGTYNPVVGDTYIQVNLGDTAKSVQGFRYQPKADGNGSFNSWEIWGYNGDATGEALTTIAAKTMTDFMSAEGVTKLGEGTWTIQGSDSSWHLANTTMPTDVKLVRLRAVTAYKTSNPAGLKNTTDNFDSISCGELRLVGYRGGSITNDRQFTITVTKGLDNSAVAASVTIGENTQTADGTTGVATFTGMSNIPYTATVSMSGYKTRTVEVSADDTNVDVALWQSVASNADVTAHKWDYPLWADVSYDASNSSHYYNLTQLHGGSVDAYSYTYHNTNADLPAWAAVDGNNTTLWHSNYQSNEGDKVGTTANGRWYEFTLEQPTKIIGLWYMPRSSGRNQPGNVTVKVSDAETAPTEAEWSALPAAGSGNMTGSNQNWVFVELPAPAQAKRVRFYSASSDHVVAAELRVVMDPENSGAKHLTGTVQTTAEGNAAIPGVTLTVANHSATSGDNGAFDLGYLPAGTYSVTASAPGYASKTQDVTISDTDTAKTVTIQLDSQTLTLSGTVSDASDTPVEGARLTLLSHDDARNHTNGVDVGVSDSNGSYSIDVTRFGQGAAYLLVTHPNYTTVCEEVTISAENGGVTTKDITLTASAPYKVYTFDNGSDVADEFVPLSSGGSTATAVLESGALKYTMVSGNDQAKNTIVNKSFVMKSGTVEFDVTANQDMTANTLFGIVVRVPGGSENRVYVGLRNATNYGYQAFGAEGGNSSVAAGNTGPAMANGVTRHIAVKVEDARTKITITVDGKQVWDCNYDAIHTLPDAGYIGFSTNAQVNDTPSFLIDNLVIRRTDLQSAVTIGTLTDGTLSTKIVTGLDTTGTDLATGDNAYAGDTIKISATGIGDGKVLAVKVTKTGDANTVVTTTKQADGSFTFTMPAYPVTITPAAATELTAVTVSGANYGEENAKYARVGNTLTVTPATGVTYQWQYSSDGTNWTNIADATAASFQLTTGQYNSTNSANKVHVVVTGDDVTYAGTVTSDAVDVQAALQEVTGVTFTRTNGVTMWLNDESKGDTGNEVGTTTVATAVIAGTPTKPLTVEWESSDTDIVTVTPIADATNGPTTATLTAQKVGNATVTVKVKAKDSAADFTTATLTVNVKAKLTGLTLKKGTGDTATTVGENETIVIYANTDAELKALSDAGITGLINKLDLSAERTPAGNDDALTWSISAKPTNVTDGGLSVEPGTDNTLTASVKLNADLTQDTISSETFVGKLGNYKVKVSNGNGVEKEVTVQLRRYANRDISITIQGVDNADAAPKYGQTLSANVNQLAMSEEGKAAAKFEWFALDASATELPSDATPFKTETGVTVQDGKDFRTLVLLNTNKDESYGDLDLIGKKIAVRVSADSATTFYDGSKTFIRGQAVVKADGPAIPSDSTIHGVKGESAENTNGKITGFPTNDGNTYEYALESAKDNADSWIPVTGSEVTVVPGTYVVRIKATATHNAGAMRNVTVGTWDSNLFTVELGTLSNGSITRDPAQAEAGATVTLTVKPNTGYELAANSLTVKPVTSAGEGTALQLTGPSADTDGNTTYTFTMPSTFSNTTTDKVTVTATFQKIKLTIDHSGLDKITCKKGSSNHSHQVDYGDEAAITLVPDTGYSLPASTGIKVYNNDDPQNRVALEGWTLSNANAAGERTITFPVSDGTGGVVHNLYIEATGVAKTYTVTHGQTTALSYSNSGNATHNTEYKTTLSVIDAQKLYYKLPDTVEVKRGETTLTEGESGDYTYNKTTGEIVIKAAAVTGPLTINALGEEIKYTISAVAIEITHTDADHSASTTPHVGDALHAKVTTDAPEGVSVTASYAWYREGVADPISTTGSTYTLQPADKDKTITVKVTGTSHFTTANEQPVTATTSAVADAIVRVTGVTLNKETTSIVFGGTETLTAAVAPENATNKKVTWGTSDASVATVDANGVVTAKGVGEATITVTTEDNSHQATCTVTVTAKDLTDDNTATVRISGALELGEELFVTFVPADAATGARYTWSIVDANGNEVYAFTDNGATVTLPNDSSYLGAKVKVVVTYGGNYSGTKTRITDGTIAGEVPSHSVVIATGIQNGTVTADKTTAKQGETVTLTVTPAAGYELDALTVTGYHGEAVATTKVDDTHYTFDMPRNLQTGDAVNVTATFKLAPVPPTTYTITVTQPEHGGVTADKETAAEGETVTLTATPAQGYKLGKFIVDGAEIDGNTFTMPAKNVTVTATFVEDTTDPEKPDTTALEAAIAAANKAKEGVVATDKAANAVEEDTPFVTTAEMKALTDAIAAAEAALKADNQTDVDNAVTTLNGAVTTFTAAKKLGTMNDDALVAAIEAAKEARAPVFVIDDTDKADVAKDVEFVTTEEMNALNDAIKTAEAALNDKDKDQTTLDAAVTTLNDAVTTFTAAKKTGESETAERPVVNTDALEDAIAKAEAAKKGVTVSDKTPAEVNRGTKFVTQEVMDALDKAIEDAQKAKDATDKTDGSVANAVDDLTAAMETFTAAIDTGTKSTGSSSSSSRPSTGTTTETKPDGTKVTTETKPDGTKVVTTESPDGSKEVVETKKDGTVTETKTDAEGAKTEKVTAPDKDVTITVTDKDGEELAKIELPAEIPAPETKFEDVPADHWAEESIHKMASLELVNGTGDNKYSPMSPMTRGALATVLHRLSQGKTDYKATFRDVANGQYYTEGVAWAAKAGVVKGITTELFAPEQSITREQLAVMMARYAKLIGLDTATDASTLDIFTDADQTGDWAVDGMAWCVKVGILQGKGDSILDPAASVSRAEVATMLDRFLAIVVK